MPEPELTIASLLRDPSLASACAQWLRGGRYQLEVIVPDREPVAALEARREGFDAMLLEQGVLDDATALALRERGLLLPAVVVGEVSGRVELHEAEVHLPPDQLEQLPYSLDAAVARFLRRGTPSLDTNGAAGVQHGEEQAAAEGSEERWKLTNRLRGRLGYLGIYYKRDPARFLRLLPEDDRDELLASLTRTYRDLLLSYFRDPASANQALESFVNTAFFSDLPITRVVEIHMNLIDRFGKQLQLEGHKNDFLQDYRLALLDVMAHLCEMYRRSIPPDAPLSAAQAAAQHQGAGPPLHADL
ncbi:MAG: circadian clock protein KaiA [Cyanobium sp.]